MKKIINCNIGDNVEWSSQAGGRTTTKNGKVVHILKVGGLTPAMIAKKHFPNHKRMFDGWGIPGGYDTGYLVEVIISPAAKPRLYMPYPSKLRVAKSASRVTKNRMSFAYTLGQKGKKFRAMVYRIKRNCPEHIGQVRFGKDRPGKSEAMERVVDFLKSSGSVLAGHEVGKNFRVSLIR